MPYDIEDEVLIDARPEEVWRWTVEDVDLERTWRNLDGKGVQTLEKLDDGPVQPGSRFRGSVKVGPTRPQTYVNVVTELDHLTRISWETVEAEGPLLGRGAYELESTNGGTRFKILLDYPPRTFMGRIQRPVVRMVGRRFIHRALSKLRRLLESDARV